MPLYDLNCLVSSVISSCIIRHSLIQVIFKFCVSDFAIFVFVTFTTHCFKKKWCPGAEFDALLRDHLCPDFQSNQYLSRISE